MKQLFHSLRIFTATYTIKMSLQILGMFIGSYVIIALVALLAAGVENISPDSFASGFLTGFVPGMAMFVPAIGAVLLNAVYTYNYPTTPGYKYFHYLHDSAEHFRRAVIAGNIVSLAVGALGTLVTFILGFFMEGIFSPLVAAEVSLIATGLINFSGLAKNAAVRFGIIMGVCLATGFFMGFTSAAEESFDNTALFVTLIAAVVICAAGLTYSMLMCRKKWRADK